MRRLTRIIICFAAICAKYNALRIQWRGSNDKAKTEICHGGAHNSQTPLFYKQNLTASQTLGDEEYCTVESAEDGEGRTGVVAYHYDPLLWGPLVWPALHLMSAGYHTDAEHSEAGTAPFIYQYNARQFIEALPYMLPCGHCGWHFSEKLKKLDLSKVARNRANLFEFFVQAHNEATRHVNEIQVEGKQLRTKKLWTLEEAKEYYYEMQSCVNDTRKSLGPDLYVDATGASTCASYLGDIECPADQKASCTSDAGTGPVCVPKVKVVQADKSQVRQSVQISNKGGLSLAQNLFNNCSGAVVGRKSPLLWGPIVWKALHIIAAGYHVPLSSDKNGSAPYIYKYYAKRFIKSLPFLLPCGPCGYHFRNLTKRYDLNEVVGTKANFIKFFVEMHNAVTQRVNEIAVDGKKLPAKKVWNVQEAATLYFDTKKCTEDSRRWSENDLREETVDNCEKYLENIQCSEGIRAVCGKDGPTCDLEDTALQSSAPAICRLTALVISWTLMTSYFV